MGERGGGGCKVRHCAGSSRISRWSTRALEYLVPVETGCSPKHSIAGLGVCVGYLCVVEVCWSCVYENMG